MGFLTGTHGSEGWAKKLIGFVAVFSGLLARVGLPVSVAAAPTGKYAAFSACPLGITTITDCVHSVIGAGGFTLGTKALSVTSPITLNGGFDGAGAEISFFGADAGATLSKVPEPVSGGLIGIRAPVSWPRTLQEE